MARGKQNDQREKIIQLELFREELPAEIKQEEVPTRVEPAPNRIRKKKSKEPLPGEIPATEESKEPPPSAAPALIISSLPPEPVKSEAVEEKEDELMEKIKKNQEARLAALRKARSKK